MAKFGIVPPNVPIQSTFYGCAPKFVGAVYEALAALDGGRLENPFEWRRTPERQLYLYGFGRTYDDGRGIVTNAETPYKTWHYYGLAVDVVEKDNTPWDAPESFWLSIAEAAEKTGRLTSGYRWTKPDKPHLQWGLCPSSPSSQDIALAKSSGIQAVWRKYNAV
jgi:D-alanyl-D-alanine carboxypeptidase-like protein